MFFGVMNNLRHPNQRTALFLVKKGNVARSEIINVPPVIRDPSIFLHWLKIHVQISSEGLQTSSL